MTTAIIMSALQTILHHVLTIIASNADQILTVGYEVFKAVTMKFMVFRGYASALKERQAWHHNPEQHTIQILKELKQIQIR
jgi:hypothetical protein